MIKSSKNILNQICFEIVRLSDYKLKLKESMSICVPSELADFYQSEPSELADCNLSSSLRSEKQLYFTKSLGLGSGLSGRLWALRACLITSFTPFGRSGRVTHATVQ